MKIKIIWILVVLLLVLILFSRTSYYDSSSSSSLTFSSSDWRSQVMQGRYILPNAPKEWIANYIDFGPSYRDLYVKLSDDQFSNMINYISKNDFYRITFYSLTYQIIKVDGEDALLRFSVYGPNNNDNSQYDEYILKYYMPSYRTEVLNNTNDPRNVKLSSLTDVELLYLLKYVSGARNTENTTDDMRKASKNLIVHGKLKEFINEKLVRDISKVNGPVINDKYLIDNMKSYTPYCKSRWWQFWKKTCK